MTNSRPCRCRRLMRNRRKLTQASRMLQSRLPNRLTCRAVLRISRRPPCLLRTTTLRRNPRLRRAILRITLPQRASVPWLAVPRRMRRPSSTVRHRNMVRTVPCRRSRLMAPQPRTALRTVRRVTRRTCLRSRNMAHTGRLRSSRSGLAILSSEIRMWVEISRTISRTRNRITVIRS